MAHPRGVAGGKRATRTKTKGGKPRRHEAAGTSGTIDPILSPTPASTLAFARRLALQLAGRLDPKIRAAIHADIARHEREHPFNPAPSEPFRPRDPESDYV